MNKEEIREQAKKIMDEFLQALDGSPELEQEFGTKRNVSIRQDMNNRYPEDSFKDGMLKNAKKTDDDQIVAEKKKW